MVATASPSLDSQQQSNDTRGGLLARKLVALAPGLALVAIAVTIAAMLNGVLGSVPLIVAAVVTGAALGNSGLASDRHLPGMAFASKTLLRGGIVLLGLRLSFGDITGLGWSVLLIIAATVSLTFVAVQLIGRKLGLSPSLSLLVASGFSICGNSAIASVSGVAEAEDEEVAAAVGLVTLCGTAAIFVVPALGSAMGLGDVELGVWVGAGVQDTAQVIAVGSAAGSAVLGVATAVKLTRVLFLAPIVAAVAALDGRSRSRNGGPQTSSRRPALLPLFVLGFLAAVAVRSSGALSNGVLDGARTVEQYLLAAGMVGLGANVRLERLRKLGARPLLLGAAAWLVVGGVSLAAVHLLGV